MQNSGHREHEYVRLYTDGYNYNSKTNRSTSARRLSVGHDSLLLLFSLDYLAMSEI